MAAGRTQMCSPCMPLRGPQGLGTHLAAVSGGGGGDSLVRVRRG